MQERAHEEEIERQRDAVDAVDAEAAEEGRINRDLATVMVARLDAGRKAAEKLLGVLQVGLGHFIVMNSISDIYPPKSKLTSCPTPWQGWSDPKVLTCIMCPPRGSCWPFQFLSTVSAK